MQYGIFVCSKCAGIHRESNTKVKGIGVCNFDDKEIAFLNKMGNDVNNQNHKKSIKKILFFNYFFII